MNVTLKKLSMQSRLSEETLCFSADIYVDGKHIGEVTNHGQGGCNDYYWIDDAKGKELLDFAIRMETEVKVVEPLDCLIDKLIEKMETNRTMRRWCKIMTVFRLKNDEADTFRTVKTIFSPMMSLYLKNKYGEQLEEIFNEKFC
jgi:hypothetical protein